MARVDFYVLEGAADRDRLVYACRLVEKAFLQDLTVCVTVDTPTEAEGLDALLWTFADRSFVPHALATDAAAVAALPPATPVWVGCQLPVRADLLVNLGADVPAFWADYARIVEVVDAEPARRDAGRRRFARYRDAGHVPDTHKVAS